MESRKEKLLLTLQLTPENSYPSAFDNRFLSNGSAFSTDFNDVPIIVANTPPYSPIGRSSFSFVPRFFPSMTSTTKKKRQSQIGKNILTYFKYCFVCGIVFTCFLLLETSPSNEDAFFEDSNLGSRQKLDSDQIAADSASDPNDIPRFRRALLVRNDNPGGNIVRDGPLFDLGDGYAAAHGDDVLITVKTSKRYHVNRLNDIIDTWFRLAPEQIYFISDSEDDNVNARTGGRLITTACPASHQRQALCCKQAAEYETYLKYGRSWWCHFDDDNYVNVPQLMRTLSQYDPREDWYLGKPSTKGPIDTPNPEYAFDSENLISNERISFWFATGGAGFCISKSLATKMIPYAADGKFAALCDRIRLPDDVTIGYVIEVLLEKNLTIVPHFHSHLESMRSIDVNRLHEEVTLSAGSYDSRDRNLVNVDSFFPDLDDPRRFRSIHCHLYPMAAVCRSRKESDSG